MGIGMNRNRFCWPRCLLLGAGLIVIGVVTIAVFVPAWVWAVLFGIGLVCYGISCRAALIGREGFLCIYTLFLCPGGSATYSGAENNGT